MSSQGLPARPHLDHLKNEAKALHKAFHAGDATAIQRVREGIGETSDVELNDAQRVIAREYGFATWAQLRAHVQSSRTLGEAVDAFLAAVQEQDADRARAVLAAQPRIATESLHVAAVLGLADDAARLIADDRSRVSTRAGQPPADPLLLLCYSPFHGESAARDAGLLATARLLLESGADPNTRDQRYSVPVLHAVTGMRSVLPIARLLLAAGANPTDGESVFHAAEHYYVDALELLLSAGADLNAVGEWGNTAIYFLLRWWDIEREPKVKQGMLWLLHHGADPNVVCGEERETSLHIAARRGQSIETVQLLLDHGAHVNARRGDGRTAWLLARRAGFGEVASLLEGHGAVAEPLTPSDELLAACSRGDVDAARRLATPATLAAMSVADHRLLPEASAAGQQSTVAACVAAGFPIDVTDPFGATALHHSALHGRAPQVRLLLDAGAATEIRDREHKSTPLGWALFGADFVADADGDYEGCTRALLEAGLRPLDGEYRPQHAGVQAVLRQFGMA